MAKMRRLATLMLFVAASSAAPAAPMTFQYSGKQGNCDECEWIAADGEITFDTLNQFNKYLQSNPRIPHLYINSPGGDLIAGVELGKLFRANHMMVEVHRTLKSGDFNDIAKGACVSACSYAFLGGETRNADSQEIGIHQFSSSVANLGTPLTVTANDGGQDAKMVLSTTQTTTSYLIEYVVNMGVDPHFLSRASSLKDVYYLEKPDLDLYKVRWQPKEFLPWGIRVSGAGIYALSETRDNTLAATVFCRADRIPRLRLTGLADAKTLKDAMADAFGITAFGTPVSKSAVEYLTVGGKSVLEVRLDKLNQASIRPNVKIFDADVPHVSRSYFEYKLSNDGVVANVAAALKNCI